MKLLGNRVAIIRDESEDTSEAGIVLPDATDPTTGYLAQHGTDVKDGFRRDCPVDARIEFANGLGPLLEVGGQEYYIVEPDAIVCVLEDGDEQ